MNKLKLIIAGFVLALTAFFAAWDASAYSCTYGCGQNYYYDEGNLGHGHVEVMPAGPVHSAIYQSIPRYMVTGLRPAHYISVQPPVYQATAPHAVYPYYGYAASRYGHSMFYGGVYSGYSGSYGTYSNRFVY